MMRRIHHRAGLTLTETIVVFAIAALLMALVIPAIQRARDVGWRLQCCNKMKQMGIAFHQYHDEYRRLPPGCGSLPNRPPTPFMGWGTRLLPYIEQQALWEQARLAYDQSKQFLMRPPHVGNRLVPLFLCSADGRESHGKPGPGHTFFLGIEGTNQLTHDGMLFLDSEVRLMDATDGTSHTLLVGERPPSADGEIGWWYAGWGQDKDGSAEMILGVREKPIYSSVKNCPESEVRFRAGRRNEQCDVLHYWSVHFFGSHFLFADGSVHFLRYSADPILPALATRAGGEPPSNWE